MASETTYKAKKIVLLIKITSIIMVVRKFQVGEKPVRGDIPPLNKSLSGHSMMTRLTNFQCNSLMLTQVVAELTHA